MKGPEDFILHTLMPEDPRLGYQRKARFSGTDLTECNKAEDLAPTKSARDRNC